MLSNVDRAKQFLPFDALKGLQSALREKEVEYVDKIVYGCCNKAGKDNQKIRPHAGTDFIRDAKKRKDRLDACINSEIQHERNGKDQQKRVENRKF